MEPEHKNKFAVRGPFSGGRWIIYNDRDVWIRKDLTVGDGPVDRSYSSYYYDSREEAEATLVAAKIAGTI